MADMAVPAVSKPCVQGSFSAFAARRIKMLFNAGAEESVLLALAGYVAFVFCADGKALSAMMDMMDAAGRVLSSLSLPIQGWL